MNNATPIGPHKSPQTMREAHIPVALKSLDEIVGRLEGASGQLLERIAPVLRMEAPTEARPAMKEPVATTTTQVADSLSVMCDRVRRVMNALQDAWERCEL